MEESSNSIVESRQDLMISSTTRPNPTSRIAHFLKPSFDSNSQAISTLSLPSLALPPTFDPQNWPLSVQFRGWKNPTSNWNEWVHQMASLHAPTWKKSGIYDAIFNSTYRFNRHNDLILGVAERWCPDINSFIFPWGEATVTLEDMLIAGYSVLGSPVFKPLETEESRAIEEALIREKKGFNKTPAKKPYHNAWLNAFMDSGCEIEHEAFLSLWLSRFVLPTSHDVICDNVFPIAIRLARGNRIALAPAVLASIYRDLSLLNEKIVSLTTFDAENDEKVDATTYAPFQLVLVWVWERFVKLSPQPNVLNIGEPRFAQWNNVKCNIEDVRSLLDSSKEVFNWRPYTKIVENWGMPKFYREKEIRVSPDSGVNEEILSLIMCLRVSELVGLESECIEQYLPQRVARQFGFDQDIPGFVAQCNAASEIAWDCYIRPVTAMECYIPSRLFEGDVTSRYLEWSEHSGKISALSSERTKKDEASKNPISKKAAGKLNRLKVSAECSEMNKKGEASNSAIRKEAEGKLKRLKVSAKSMKNCGTSRKKSAGEFNGTEVSAKSSERMKKGNTSNSLSRKKAASKLKGSRVSVNCPKIMKEEETISSSKITPNITKQKLEQIVKRKISSEVSVAHANRAKQSKISAESSRIKNKESNKPAISLVVELNDFLVPPENDTVKAGDPTADDNITIAEMIKRKKKHNATASKKQCAGGEKLADKLDSHVSPVAANEFAKTSDIALSGAREGQSEAIENENDGDSKTASSQSRSYSSSPADNESQKSSYDEKLKRSEACESKQTCSSGNVSDESHLSANKMSPNVLDPVASKEKVKHSTVGRSEDDTRNKAVAQLGGFHSHAENEPLKVLEPAPLVETLVLGKETEYVLNVDHVDSISSANNTALEVVKSTMSMEKLNLSKEAKRGQDMDIENAPRQFDQSESHSSSVAGNETPKVSEIPKNVISSETRSLTKNDSSRGNVAQNGNKGSNEYSIGAPKLMLLEARIEKLGKIMAARKAVLFQKHL